MPCCQAPLQTSTRTSQDMQQGAEAQQAAGSKGCGSRACCAKAQRTAGNHASRSAGCRCTAGSQPAGAGSVRHWTSCSSRHVDCCGRFEVAQDWASRHPQAAASCEHCGAAAHPDVLCHRASQQGGLLSSSFLALHRSTVRLQGHTEASSCNELCMSLFLSKFPAWLTHVSAGWAVMAFHLMEAPTHIINHVHRRRCARTR